MDSNSADVKYEVQFVIDRLPFVIDKKPILSWITCISSEMELDLRLEVLLDLR